MSPTGTPRQALSGWRRGRKPLAGFLGRFAPQPHAIGQENLSGGDRQSPRRLKEQEQAWSGDAVKGHKDPPLPRPSSTRP